MILKKIMNFTQVVETPALTNNSPSQDYNNPYDQPTTNVSLNQQQSISGLRVPHVTATCKSAFYHLRNIYKIRRFLTPETTESIIHAFVTSRIDYCNSLLYGLPKCVLKKLQYVQNSAARLIYLSKKFDHVTPLLISLHWLPIEQRINFKILLITYKALNGKAPKYISDLLSPYSPGRNLRSANQKLLCKASYNLKTYGARSFSCAAPLLWNSIPYDLRNSSAIDTFKRKLKTWLFCIAFSNQ